MTAVSVTADNVRLTDAETITNWSDIGGGQGGAQEPDFFYQGNFSYARKISTTADRGIYYLNPTGIDMTAPGRRHMIFKYIITNYAAAPTSTANGTGGIGIEIGSGTGDFVRNSSTGSDTYPSRGGFLLKAFAPNSNHVSSTSGTPALTTAAYFGLRAITAFTATAKEQNVAMDAVDIGAGLNVVGGTTPDPAGTFSDFVAFDQDTTTNRFGYVTETDGIISVQGKLVVGRDNVSTVAATRFQDTGSQIVFIDGLFEAGFSGIDLDVSDASTEILIQNGSITSVGSEFGAEDTRAEILVTGTSGLGTYIGMTFSGIGSFVNNSRITYDGCSFVEAGKFIHGGSTVSDCIFRQPNVATNEALIVTSNPTPISNTIFESSGTGHAIEITSPGTYSLIGCEFDNYSGVAGDNLVENSGSGDAAILNSSGGLVTINVSGGGDSPSVRNTGAGSTTIVNANVTVNITGLPNVTTEINKTEIRVFGPGTGTTTEFAGVGTESHELTTYSFSIAAGTTFDVRIINLDYVPFYIRNQTAVSDPTNIPVSLREDRVGL